MMPGVAIALREMVAGEKRRVWVPAGLTFRPEDHQAGSGPPLTVDVEVVQILRAPRTPANLGQPPEEAARTASGVRIQWLRRGPTGPHPSMGNRLRVNYTGWTAAGDVFETTAMSGHPAEVLLGMAMPGWREALPLMSAGDKTRLWIPGPLVYGDRPNSRKRPAGDLVYDIELISFR
jgi:FKBP-type peptidyl-prolyl cis-trans isomerase